MKVDLMFVLALLQMNIQNLVSAFLRILKGLDFLAEEGLVLSGSPYIVSQSEK